MHYAIREELAWLIENARLVHPTRDWMCLHHPETKIEQTMRRRSLWLYPMAHAGFGNVIPVLHIGCPLCHPERLRVNDEGEGIYTIQLIAVDEHLMPVKPEESLEQLFGLLRPVIPA